MVKNEEMAAKTQMTMGAKMANGQNVRKDEKHKNSESDKMVKTKNGCYRPNITEYCKNGQQQQISRIISVIGNI